MCENRFHDGCEAICSGRSAGPPAGDRFARRLGRLGHPVGQRGVVVEDDEILSLLHLPAAGPLARHPLGQGDGSACGLDVVKFGDDLEVVGLGALAHDVEAVPGEPHGHLVGLGTGRWGEPVGDSDSLGLDVRDGSDR